MSTTKTYEIVKEKTLLVGSEFRRKGDTVNSKEVSEKRIAQFIKEGVLLLETDAKKAKKDAETAKKVSKDDALKIAALEKDKKEASEKHAQEIDALIEENKEVSEKLSSDYALAKEELEKVSKELEDLKKSLVKQK